jgi:hypothetical protein
VTKQSQLALVRPKLSEDEVKAIVGTGNFKPSELIEQSGLSRARVRKIIADTPHTKLTMPSRKGTNPVAAAPVSAPKPRASEPPPLPGEPQSPIIRRFIGAGILLVAVGFGIGGGIMNYRFGVSFGQDDASRLVLGGLTILIDGGALLLFAAAGYLREQKNSLWMWALLIWLICWGLSIGAGLGYQSSNIGDSLQSRDSVIQNRRVLVAELSRAEADRGKITEGRDPQAIEQQIQIEQGKVPSKNWASSAYCTSVTLSGPFCMALNQERAAKAAAEQRIELDAKIRKLSTEIAALPPVSAKDPAAEQIAAMSLGFLTAEQVRGYIVRCLAIIPGFASILLAIARTLLR